MKFLNRITPLFIAGTVGSAVALSLLPILNHNSKAAVVELAQILSPEQVNLRAKQTIVRIDGTSVGSGTLIERSDNSYTVLTNWHVVKDLGDYTVQPIDGRTYQVDSATIKQLPGLDLAILKFDSNQNYQVAELGDSSNLSEGQNVYFAGYPGELRSEDNRYYRFFTANLVGILPKSTENGYSLIYSGEAFPGMSGGPVFNQKGLMIGVHGEANIHAMSGAISNYGIPINSYQQAIAQLNSEPTANASPSEAPATPEVATDANTPSNNSEQSDSIELSEPNPNASPEAAATPEVATDSNTQANDSEQSDSAESLDSNNISSVPTFTPGSSQDSEPEAVEEVETAAEPEAVEEAETAAEPEVVEEAETAAEPEVVEEAETAAEPEAVEEVETAAEPEADRDSEPEVAANPEPVESEEVDIPTVTRKIPLISQKTGIDYTKLRNLLREEKWSEADIHTDLLVEQIVKTAKQQNKHVFIELKSIAEFSCSDIRTIDYLWKKYSDNKFGFSRQQNVWQSVNQEGDFSTQTWRRFATEVGWKQGEVTSGSGYKLYEELNFEPAKAPVGHLPWWFALPDEEQNVIKSLFSRCNFNPTVEELEAEAKSQNTAQNPADNQNEAAENNETNIDKTPESADKK